MKPMPPAVETDVARGRFGKLVPVMDVPWILDLSRMLMLVRFISEYRYHSDICCGRGILASLNVG